MQPQTICSNCQNPVNNDDKFCSKCGIKLEATPQIHPTDANPVQTRAIPPEPSIAFNHEERIKKLEALTDTTILKGNFWGRAFSIYGYVILIQIILTAVIYACVFAIGLLGTFVQ